MQRQDQFDELLMEFIAAGDRHALELLARLTRHQLTSIARRAIDSEVAVRHVIVEVYEYVFEHAEEFRTARSGLMHWLAVVAEELAAAYLVSQRPEPSLRRA